MKTITMLLSNPFKPDPRVDKEAKSLSKWGFQVNIIAWDRQKEFPEFEEREYARIYRIQNVRSAYYAGIKQIFVIPLFWNAAIKIASQLDSDVIHCHDLDTLYAGVRIKESTSCKLIFDAHENYPAMMSLYLPRFFTRVLARLEQRLMTRVDHTLTASFTLANFYQRQSGITCTVVPNSPDLLAFNNLDNNRIEALRQNFLTDRDQLLVGYIGGLTRNRLLEPLLLAAQKNPDIRVMIWGDGIKRPIIEALSSGYTNINYLGWLDPAYIPLYTSTLDLVYYGIDSDYPGAIYNAPNSLGYALAAGKPILANRVGDLGTIIEQEMCGVVLEEVTPETIQQALDAMRSPTTRTQLGKAGRKFAENEFNWNSSSQKMIEAYHNLLSS